MAALRIVAIGLAMPFPAMSGAEPPLGSYSPNFVSFKDADERLKPYLNRKSLGWSFFCPNVKRTLEPGLKDDLIAAFNTIKPLYRLLCGLE